MRQINWFRFLSAFIFILFSSLLFYIVFADEGNEQKQEKITMAEQEQQKTTGKNSSFFIPPDWLYQDAPNPDTTLESFMKSRELWPDIGNQQFTEEHREKVRQEWLDFAAHHPDNLFIPQELQNRTKEQLEAIRRDNDLAGDYAARQAAFKAQEKYRTPGEEPPEQNLPAPDPKQQQTWLEYKVKETKSMIEVIEYFIEKGEPDSTQVAEGQRDLTKLKKELSGYEKALSEVPK